MRALNVVFALFLSLAMHAQTRDVTDSGTYVFDESGRCVRLEGRDGIVVDYLYDVPGTDETSGVAVHVNDKVTLTVKFRSGDDEIAVPGLPKITQAYDFRRRPTAVFADGKPIAYVDYMRDGYFASVTLPGHFKWKCSAPDGAQRVRQSVEDASGQIVANTLVTTDFASGIPHSASYDAAEVELGANPNALTYEDSTTGAVTTARDAKGSVVFYIVGAPRFDVAFSPTGKPLFYDIHLLVEDRESVPGSCLITSKTSEGQRGTYPDHLVLTARGVVGLYATELANGAVEAVWMNLAGKMFAKSSEVERDSRPRQ